MTSEKEKLTENSNTEELEIIVPSDPMMPSDSLAINISPNLPVTKTEEI
jgi:hypothetical protein